VTVAYTTTRGTTARWIAALFPADVERLNEAADRLGAAFLQGDHAGAWETSLMMAAAPAMVRERERISLPPIDGLLPAIKKGAKNFAEAGGEDAYFGDPTAASAEDGESYFDALAEVLSLSVMEHLGSKA